MLPAHNRVVMISGASRGIGAEITRRLATDGFQLSLGVRDARRSPYSDRERCLVVPYEARDPEAAKRWVAATVERFGRIDAVVNNAGISIASTVEDESEEALDEMWLINVKAPLRVVRAALPYLKQCGRGRVIQVASLSGKRVIRNSHGYAMTKFAAVALSHSVRRLGWEHGIRATALCPGSVASDMTAKYDERERAEMTQPEDLASLVACLLTLPNNAAIAELLVNCRYEDVY